MYVRAKKSLGQHFLKDPKIAKRIVDSLVLSDYNQNDKIDVIEVGPGTGVLTQFLANEPVINLKLVEIDSESVEYLKVHYPALESSLYEADFLRMKLEDIFKEEFIVIGNFPYNISSQIFFKVLDYKERVPQVVGMVQKEVAERLASPPGKKAYGILSVLLQAWYSIEYLFTVDENEFIPPPKVKSAVIRLLRNSRESLGCDEALFKAVVKTSFNQRRKTIRNSLKPLIGGLVLPESYLFAKRPEQLSVEEFVELTLIVNSLKEAQTT
ncbi:MAG: 16S rRNA (adenine(1518)-N(6)/adenine(1519)-N(6))-dimethyltransferase [Bacteroidetes bacterium GWE2_39_28]|jgi:16S rRNA (adenine1518-N6/adenine1519-N6)-dimethyltransferase|nr:16S rRNA (adenine(1518)-N(6)/adenine(1519)-N(6))-dimethyltransferase RsmA [Bacteroidales bacterium]OFX78280.1 MAG: 16S rRNA (adenine(1518)-N(6)/adenine(1519)-N(6))-dimethyltransferase [Bacteroidetes bacterium GWE2_39_28]OFY12002.1 MAG: 16S rRNA (adenine(1518)-N(6)/adenine(1519)-N(6))-dimethyltransferase [Bacteroidetes bacterium GWF2_39_10]OFZ11257.1 MAG: 16S rRNA (adenine(1518)-N(6)/adenine(1519)-N(6))-dimethyltransferase [Bacteroidetes bacterium RIFOXYC2_FULL_39_11]HCT95103.1 16S rRNA (aden